jgi:hypothetical protein
VRFYIKAFTFLDYYIITVSILTYTATAAGGDGALWISFTFEAITFSFLFHFNTSLDKIRLDRSSG